MWSNRTMNPNTLGVFFILTNECCVLITRYTEDQLSLQSNLIDLLKYCNRSDEGLTLKRQPLNSLRWLIYVFDSVVDTKLPLEILYHTSLRTFLS